MMTPDIGLVKAMRAFSAQVRRRKRNPTTENRTTRRSIFEKAGGSAKKKRGEGGLSFLVTQIQPRKLPKET